MRTKLAWTLVLVAASIAAAAPAGGQSIQYRSAAGVEYRSQRDTGAIARAESALAADPRNVELIIQLGLAQSGARQFREAIETFTRGLTIAPNDAVLYRRPDSLPATNAYAQRLRLYRGQIRPDDVITAADTGDIAVATLSYGVGNWYLVRGDTARARGWFERSVRSGGWPAFGFIMSEVELRRLR